MTVSTMYRPMDTDPARMFWGWSHDNARMELMDLPDYLDSFRVGYERAVEDMRTRYLSMVDMLGSASRGYARTGRAGWRHDASDCGCSDRHGHHPHEEGRGGHSPDPDPDHDHDHDHDCGCGGHGHGHWEHDHDHGRRGGPGGPSREERGWHGEDHGRHREHWGHGHDCGCSERGHHDHHGYHHDHHDHHDHDCGCGGHHDCRCECCIGGDADIVVYGRCGEIRVIPIEVENDTRKVREDVTVEVSEVRSGGGRVLPWQVRVDQEGPLTLEPCSTTKLELLVHIACADHKQEPEPKPNPEQPKAEQPARKTAKAVAAAEPEEEAVIGRISTRRGGDVDECEVGYVTVRLGGCVVRPIVVAIAAVPTDCGSYSANCSCC